MCGMCPDVIDGCYDDACVLRDAEGNRLRHYVDWKMAGDEYCAHLAAKHGHSHALWWDKYGCEHEECDGPEGRHDADCPSLGKDGS